MEQREIEMFAGIVAKTIEPIKEKIDIIDEKVDNLGERVDSLDKKVDILDKRVDGLDKKVDSLNKRVDNLDFEVREIKLSLENEVNPKINIIAEGHSILNRKLDQYISYVLMVQDDEEQMKLRLVYLESEAKKVKERLASLIPTA